LLFTENRKEKQKNNDTLQAKYFNTMEKQNLKHHFINLYLIALSDGSFEDEELDVILKIATEKGISEEEFKEFITNPTNVTIEIPEDFLSKIKLLYDFTRVILADGKIDDEEKSLFMKLCGNYNFEAEESEELFNWLIDLANKDLPTDRIDEELQTLIN
jgi:uncharacterized tellurite resistance protein B-like protein